MLPTRLLNMPNAVNLRELGGYPAANGQFIAWRKLLRSGSLGHLDHADAATLAGYGVVAVADLRTDAEQATRPDVLPATITPHALSVYPFTDRVNPLAKTARRMRRALRHSSGLMPTTYLQMLVDSHAQQTFRQLFGLLLATPQPRHAVLFHCAAGKDRTGMAAMLIEAALGVPEATMREDYLLTNLVLARPSGLATELTHGASSLVNQMNAHTAEVENFAVVADFIATNYGDWQHYLTATLLSSGELADLRRLYLTDTPDPRG